MSGADIHQRTMESFSAYLDGELPPQAKAKVDEHIATCLQCRVALERLRRTVAGLGGLRRSAPKSFLADIERQINTRSNGRFFGKKRLWGGRIPFEWISLATIIAMLIYYIVTLQSSPTGVVPGP